jgi:integrase
MLPGAHRTTRLKGGWFYIWWRSGRERGAVTFWSCRAPTQAAAEALERDDAGEIARRYSLIASPRPSPGFVASLIVDFKSSPEWAALAPRTQVEWTRHLDRIRDVFGATALATIEQRGARKLIKLWHQGMSRTPRTANAALSVLVRLFNFGVDQEDLARNPAERIARLDEGPSRTAIVWSREEFDRLLSVKPASGQGVSEAQANRPLIGPARRAALELCWLTGLRREDLIRLRWDEVDLEGAMIRRPTLKSRGRHVARINIGPELRELLVSMKPDDDARLKSVTVVTSELGKPYKSPDAFSSSVRTALDTADVRAADGRRKHLHDIRGTRATLKFAEGCSDADAEAWFGWAPGQGADMRAIYGDPETIAQAAGKKLRRVG